ncbi:MAG: hypothetical protein ISS82_03390 [Nanoarchaeota archaeon]|nr:hypothetical protein [Nanoarchaeota archaeon]
MNLLKKSVVFFGIFLLLINISYAASFEINSEAVKDIIIKSGDAIFDITIKNKQDFSDSVTYVISDLNWDWEKKYFNLGKNMETSFELILTTPENMQPGIYNLNLKVYSQNNPDVYDYESLIVKVLDYSDLIEVEELSKTMPQGLDPRKDNLVKLELKNKNDIELNNVKVRLESELFNKEFVFDFSPLGRRTEEFYVDIDDNTKEGNYDVRVLSTMEDNILIERVDNVKVSFYSDVQEDKEESSGFLTKKLIVTRENKGNIDSVEEYRLSLNSFEKTFTRTSLKPTSIEKEGGVYYYTWNFELGPGESYRIVATTNYRDPIIFLILFGFMIYILYTILRSGVSLKKKVLTLKSGSGISDMKILLILKNKGNKMIKNVKLIDTLPRLVKTPEDYGTLEPDQIKKSSEGNKMLIWRLDNLVGKEERVISYRLKSDLHVIGKFGIHKAVCVYKKGNNNVMVKSNSNIVFS